MSAATIAVRPIDKYMIFLERRARQRFPLALALEYKLLGRGERWGSGKTRNISSCGVLFEVAEPELVIGPIELMVSWPCVLDNVCALKLVMKGRVVRSEERGVAIESTQHEFRTAGLRPARKVRI
jgi:hypothetical protein